MHYGSSHSQKLPSRERSETQSSESIKRRFQLILIKPSHYDDEGYVIRWWRAMISIKFARCRIRNCG